MSDKRFNLKSRRSFLAGSAALLATPALAQSTSSVNSAATTETERDLTEVVRRNISSFRTLDWQPYFDNTKNGAILVDIDSRAVHYWSEDQSVYKLYPSSVPLTDDLT
ncbi:MAG: L,D-transpeptidase, partial [Sulfitobacter geojensis]